MGSGAGAGAGLLTKDSCFMLPLRLRVLDLGRGRESSALWSSSRRACAVATSSKNSSLCSEVTEEKMTAQRNRRVFFHVRWQEWNIYSAIRNESVLQRENTSVWISSLQCSAWLPTSVRRLGGVGLRVAPPPPDATLQPEGAALVIEPPALLQRAQQLVQSLREVGG